MSIFQTKKVKLEKRVKDGVYQYSIDYMKCKESNTFLLDFFKAFTEEENSLYVIDSCMFYEEKESDFESIINTIISELNKAEIAYKQLVVKRDSNQRLLGMNVGNSKKVKNYQIGIAANAVQSRECAMIVTRYNGFCYRMGDISPELLLEQFDQLRGDMEELMAQSVSSLYHDVFSHRIKIDSTNELDQRVEAVVKQYEK
jgi:hypothetical protein